MKILTLVSTHEMRASRSSNSVEDLHWKEAWVSPASISMKRTKQQFCIKVRLLPSNITTKATEVMSSIPKLVNTFCMPEVGEEEEKTVSRQEVGREARELCRVQKLFDRDIIRDAPARLNAMPRAACQKFAFKLAMKGRK